MASIGTHCMNAQGMFAIVIHRKLCQQMLLTFALVSKSEWPSGLKITSLLSLPYRR